MTMVLNFFQWKPCNCLWCISLHFVITDEVENQTGGIAIDFCTVIAPFWFSTERWIMTMSFWGYHHRLCTVIVPFWFSTEHRWIVITPFWFSEHCWIVIITFLRYCRRLCTVTMSFLLSSDHVDLYFFYTDEVESICSSSDSDMLDDYCVIPLPDCFDPSKPIDKSMIMSRTSLTSSMVSHHSFYSKPLAQNIWDSFSLKIPLNFHEWEGMTFLLIISEKNKIIRDVSDTCLPSEEIP